MILRDLKKGKKITQAYAIEKYGCLRLSARIFDLREEGNDIKMRMIPVKNRWGDTCMVAQYRMEK